MTATTHPFPLPLLLAAVLASALFTNGAEPARWRGAMISPAASADDLLALRRLGANHVRWQLTWAGFPNSPADSASPEAYDQWLQGVLAHVDEALPVCEKAGFRVCLDLHTPPGGRDKSYNCRLFQEAKCQDQFVAVWRMMARRYQGRSAIAAFDLLNEPVQGEVAPDCVPWRELALRAARAIREIDPGRTLVYEPAPWAKASAFKALEPLPLENVIYSFHFYLPMDFTHQGVHGRPMGPEYPGVIGKKDWNKQTMRAAVAAVVDFQRKRKVPIYVGEFSAARWARGGNLWLRDALDLWEELGWSWAYHAFREADVWSPEHDAIPDHKTRSPTPTERQRLLSSYFSRNLSGVRR